MTGQARYLARSLVFLALAGLVVLALYPIVLRAFLHSPYLNGLILATAAIGIGYNLRRIVELRPEQAWIEASRTARPGVPLPAAPRLIAPVASLLGDRERRGRALLSPLAVRHLLDSTSARLDESRDIARYLTGLLIFLGLLGTFWGLLEAINSVGDVIGGLTLGGDDIVRLFDEMKAGLARPLTGMGTAFSASLFGLASSLILGFLDLQATQGQNAFYNDLEEWLTGMARLGGPELPGGDGPSQPMPVYVQAMLQQTAENLDQLQEQIARGESGRAQLTTVLAALTERLGGLADRASREPELLARLAEAQSRLLDRLDRPAPALDEPAREHLRSMDQRLGQLVEAMGREREELKHELRLVARAIAIAAGEPPSGRA